VGETFQCLLPATHSQDFINTYETHGEDCVFHLHTEFAFVLFDKHEKSYFAARDPIGLSPLYYSHQGDNYHFASDIESLFAQSGIKKEANILAMEGIVHHSAIPYADTMYKGIKRLPPGHYMKISATGQCTLVRYWKPEEIKINYKISKDEATKRFKELFEQAISNRIDEPSTTACELSGGLDSSSVVSWIKHKSPEYKLTCFSMTFDSLEKCDESNYVDEIDKTFDINLVKLQTDTLDYKNTLNLEYNYDLNPHWPIFLTYTMGLPLVNKAREMGVKTILTGQGGDHVTAGNLYCLNDYFRHFRWHLLLRELHAFGNPVQLMKRFVLLPFLGERSRKFILKILHPFHRKNPQRPRKPETSFEEFSELYTGKSLSFKYDLAQVVISNNSAMLDNSYYQVAEAKFGIKFRHPFFDRRLVEFMLSLPPNFKLNRGRSKFLLREAMKGILPDKIRLRSSKAKFNDVLRQQIDGIDLDTLLVSAQIAKLGLIEQSRLDEMRRKYQSGQLTAIVYFWQVLNLEYWYRYNFINPPESHLHQNP